MSTDGHGGVVLPLRLRPEKAQAIIREIAKDTSNVIMGYHVKQRIEERELSDIQVYRILQTGHVFDEPERTEYNEWKCKIVRQVKGNREAGVVLVILRAGKLFLKTVEWEDRR